MRIFHPARCICACGKMFISSVAMADYDRVNLNGEIDCPDCQEKKQTSKRNRRINYGLQTGRPQKANAV